MEIVMSLVFASVLLVFMIYPAIKIIEIVEKKFTINDKMYNILTVVLTIILALFTGVALYFI